MIQKNCFIGLLFIGQLNFLTANNGNCSRITTKLLFCLFQGIHLSRRCAKSSHKDHDLLSVVATVGNAFVCFQIILHSSIENSN